MGLSVVGLGLFMLVSLVVSVRLLRLWHATHQQPELLLAIALLCTGFVGFALEMVGGMIPGESAAFRFGLHLAGLSGEYVGAVALVVFARRVFHPHARWAAMLAWTMVGLLVAALLAEWLSGQYVHYMDGQPAEGPVIPLGLAARGAAPTWMAIAAFRYHGMLRRRARLGLADPMVVRRVWLWAIASACSALGHAVSVVHRSIWGTGLEAHAWALDLVAGLAFVSAVCIGLAFFPPRAYRRWVESHA